MMNLNFDDFKVRCSAIGKVLSNSRSNPQLTEKQTETLNKYREKLNSGQQLTGNQNLEMIALIEKEANGSRVILSDTCIDYLMEEYAWATEKMISVSKEALELLAADKGRMVELESIDLLIRLDKLPYEVCKWRQYNDFLSGELDVFLGEVVVDVIKAEKVIDIKNSWDYPIFLKKINKEIDSDHRRQVQGYMDITGAVQGEITHTLISAPPEIIEDMLWKITRKLRAATPESPEVLREWPKWERSMKFDHMPIEKRVFKLKVEPFTSFERQQLYDRVKVCREWLNKFHEQYQKLNK